MRLPALAYRSLLFVPAHDEQRLAAAFASGADAVVADLEDATPVTHKAPARELVARALPAMEGAARLVRINVPGSDLAAADLEAVTGLALDALVVPQATPERVASLGPDGPPVIAVVESAVGLRLAYELASQPRVHALVLGANDLGADLGLEPRADALELLFARSKVVADSRAAGIRAPFDRVFSRGEDLEGLEADARFARSLGFGGKGCLDPAQPGVLNRVFGAASEHLRAPRG
jgi:citrate lyase beta subunit